MLSRFVFLSSTAACVLLSIAVYATLTGFDLAHAGIAVGKLPQWFVFFGLINLVIWLAGTAAGRIIVVQRGSITDLASYATGSIGLVAGIILGTCWRLDGHLGDLPQFLRFEVARVICVIAPLLATISYAVARRLRAPTLSSVVIASWLKTGIALGSGVALAALFYLWDNVRPWPDPMPQQLLVVMCALIGPAFLLAVLSAGLRGVARFWPACGVVGLTLIAALL